MKTDKELYRQLRGVPRDRLWTEEVPRFNSASPRERMARVAVIRAVGAAFASSGTTAQRAEVRSWLVGLLRDPSEKIRRYAMTALPKLGAGPGEEAELLSLLRTTGVERERKFLGRTLDKIGGRATLEAVKAAGGLLPQTEQKVKARVARRQSPGRVRMDCRLERFEGLRIHLRCRRGLETIVRDEAGERLVTPGRFRGIEIRRGLVVLAPAAPFSLADLYALRCFDAVNFVLGTAPAAGGAEYIEALASAIASPLSRRLLSAFTEGAPRYRLEFIARGHQRGAVRLVANRAYALCPDILNDPRRATWAVDIHPQGRGSVVELRPRLTPDPRFIYRRDDVAAASHPPLAACMARLAGRAEGEIVWDPFCGSGLELIERALRGGVRQVYGTDVSPEALAIARENFAAAKLESVPARFTCCDFRESSAVEWLGPDSVTLIITNPPMGRRIRIPDLRGLFSDFFRVAGRALKPGGRLVFVNPLRLGPADAALQLQFRQTVDLGGFDARLEVYRKS
ncbi:MAG TPA: methyltransferase [Kiritimatiellia bacterium]|nr:methyltransferase [Kiritimatiellia bacterium]HRZ12825.1 methyltransferase [Kiritimatiellia bacterium]HSA18223.1 methyltransferase [Kiritimatiellia bacterium]